MPGERLGSQRRSEWQRLKAEMHWGKGREDLTGIGRTSDLILKVLSRVVTSQTHILENTLCMKSSCKWARMETGHSWRRTTVITEGRGNGASG